MAYVTCGQMNNLSGCGDVEMLLWFCDFISRGPIQPYHAEFLSKRLLREVRLWPVYLESNQIAKMVYQTYAIALKKHFGRNSSGPWPRDIKYNALHKTVRYFTQNGIVITLDMTTASLFIQSRSHGAAFMHSLAGMSPVFQVDTDHVLNPDEIRNLPVLLGEVCRLLQSR